MRKGSDGLALLVQQTLKRDPHSGHLFVFCGRRGGLIKVLWEACACEAAGTRPLHLAVADRRRRDDLIGAAGHLLKGIDWRMPQKTWRPRAAG
jgi:transposase